MTSDQFRESADLVASLKKLLTEDATLRLAISILDDESPIYDPPVILNENATAVAYGFEKGYEARGKRLRELATHGPVNVPLEPDYSQP